MVYFEMQRAYVIQDDEMTAHADVFYCCASCCLRCITSYYIYSIYIKFANGLTSPSRESLYQTLKQTGISTWICYITHE